MLSGSPNLARWLYHADTAAFRLTRDGPLDASRPPFDQLSQLNVLAQLDHLATYPIVREQVAKGLLQLIGWWFDIATGDMHAWRERDRSFVLIDRTFADLGQLPRPNEPRHLMLFRTAQASRSLMIMSERDARRPEEHEQDLL